MIKVSSSKKPKVAIYIRVSTEEQAKEGYSLSAQESALKDYISMMGYDLYKIYRDEGKSAKDIKHRPALQQLLKDAEKKSFKAICVYKLDRFSRSLKDLILTIEKLKTLNIDFISLQDKIETASASGKLMFHIISSFAEFERDIISERTRFGMTEKAKGGGVISKAPLGYNIQEGKLVLDPSKKEEIIQIFKTFIETNQSLNAIARAHRLSVSGLIKILQNRTYIGEIKFRENYAGTHEIMLDLETFEKAQSKLNKNSYDREYLRYNNFIQGLDSNLDMTCVDELALALSKKQIVYKKKDWKDLGLDIPSLEELKNISEPFKLQKHIATQLLLEEGFSEEDISYNRVFVNADKVDLYANSTDKKVYVDCAPSNIHKILEYLHNDIEYWLVLGNEAELVKVYVFSKTQE